MKKFLFAALLTGASMLSLSAHAEGAYAGIAVERSGQSIDVTGATTTSSNSHPTGFKLYGGYKFTPNLGVEGGYADLGSAKTSFTTSIGNGSVEAKNTAFYIAGKGTAVINDQFSAYGKLGFSRNKNDFSGSGLGARFAGGTNKTDLYASVGLAYQFTKNLAATVEYENFGKFDSGTAAGSVRANVLSAGLRFDF
jgi:OOP family OmpA-OmpF porin